MRTTTDVVRDQILKLLSQRTMTFHEVSVETGFSYKTVHTRMLELRRDGKVIPAGKRGHRDLWKSATPQIIPAIPGPVEPISPLAFINRMYETKGDYVTKLDRLLQRWPINLVSIFRTAVLLKTELVFPADRHKAYEDYLKELRSELDLRLRQVNALLQSSEYWTEEGLRSFQQDNYFNHNTKMIEETYEMLIHGNQGDKK